VSAAYLDSSLLIGILFGEPGARALARMVDRFDALFTGDLLVAEVLAAAAREGLEPAAVGRVLAPVSLVLPPRTLEPEMNEALRHGRLRGADLWHVACALFLAGPAREDLSFLSRDEAQRRVASRLGFPTP